MPGEEAVSDYYRTSWRRKTLAAKGAMGRGTGEAQKVVDLRCGSGWHVRPRRR